MVGRSLLVRVRDRAVVLDQGLAFIDEEFGLAIRAQELDAGIAQVLVMDVEFLLAFGAAGIEVLDHLGPPYGRSCSALLVDLSDRRSRPDEGVAPPAFRFEGERFFSTHCRFAQRRRTLDARRRLLSGRQEDVCGRRLGVE